MSRFDYVKYDKDATTLRAHFKDLMSDLETDINAIGNNITLASARDPHALPELGRAKSLALTKLEELYMWIGKAIRDAQRARTGSAEPQEERKNR